MKISSNDSIINPFPPMVTFCHILQQTIFENTVTKWAISPFATIISNFLRYYTYNFRDFSYFGVDIFKVVCCRFAVCGKRLNVVAQEEIVHNFSFCGKGLNNIHKFNYYLNFMNIFTMYFKPEAIKSIEN